MNISDLSPASVWKHFDALCSIPRPSGHEQRAVRYISDFAQARGLKWVIDEVGNIIVRKEASVGLEGRKGVILQSHIDMVPQKNEGSLHDFLTDPIIPYVDGEWVKARGTTLGADNGIGAAVALAVLEDRSMIHGPVEALFTVDEEAGMTGAKNFSAGMLTGKAFINLDTGHEEEIITGCAGGLDVTASIPVEYEQAAGSTEFFLLSVNGLRGGHSGLDINLGRANAIKVLVRALYKISGELDIRISSIRGGSARNAIPREAFCKLAVPKERLEEFTRYIRQIEIEIKSELSLTDPDLKINIDISNQEHSAVMTPRSQLCLIRSLYACPDGVFRLSGKVPGIVETSGNLAIVNTGENTVEAQCLLRSLAGTAKDDLAAMVESTFKLAGADVRFDGEYPGWEPDPNSQLLGIMKKVYAETFGRDAVVNVVHAGLECGIIGAKYPDMEFVSVGPTIKYAHSPDERLHIESVGRFWKILVTVLKLGLNSQ
ncbi:MAG: aminoacyl-histidine dipeptidase [Chitinispirillales bacterium]|jgi:dipeptidase D|nr:aminoacyl-histidine dipeptidase [Chitinispirillales bacterium]